MFYYSIDRAAARIAKADFNGAVADCSEAIRQFDASPVFSADPAAAVVQGSGATNQEARDMLAAYEVSAYTNRGRARQATGDWDGVVADYSKVYELKRAALKYPRQGEFGIAAV